MCTQILPKSHGILWIYSAFRKHSDQKKKDDNNSWKCILSGMECKM